MDRCGTGFVNTIVSVPDADQWDAAAALLADNPAPVGRENAWAQAMTFLDAGRRDDVHLLASVLVVDGGGKVLLARHRRYGRWGALGGHLDSSDASLSAGAARELLEEASLVAQIHPAPVDVLLAPYPCRTAAEAVLHLDVRFAASVAARNPALVASDELTGLEWFAACSLPAPLTPDTAELIALATTLLALPR